MKEKKVHALTNPEEAGKLNTELDPESSKIHKLDVPLSILSEEMIR